MKLFTPPLIQAFGKLALLAVLFSLPATVVHAQEKAVKSRGNILSIDVAAKSLTLDKKKSKLATIFWDENTTLQSDTITQITDLKPGIYVRCIMVGNTDVIARIRHEPDKDKVAGDSAATE